MAIALGLFACLPIAIVALVVSADKLAVYGVLGGALVLVVQVVGAFADWRTGRSASFSFEGMDPLYLACGFVLVLIGLSWIITNIVLEQKTGSTVGDYLSDFFDDLLFE